MTREAIETWLIERVSAAANIPREKVDLDRSPESLGLDSLAAVTLLADLGDWLFGRELAPDLLWGAPSLRALCAQLADQIKQMAA
jgi:acyl carrier protein